MKSNHYSFHIRTDACHVQALTRRDQLGIKRAPPSKRKGRGKTGKKEDKKSSVGAKNKAKSMGKDVKTNGSSKKNAKKKIPKHDVEDETVTEEEAPPRLVSPPQKPKAKAAPKEKTRKREHDPDTKHTKSTKNGQKDKALQDEAATETVSGRKRSRGTVSGGQKVGKEKKTVAPKSRVRVKSAESGRAENIQSELFNFVENVNLELEGDDFKKNIRQLVPDLGKGSLNIYWKTVSCGLRWSFGRTTRDIAFFKFSKPCPGTNNLKMVVAIACAVELVPWPNWCEFFLL